MAVSASAKSGPGGCSTGRHPERAASRSATDARLGSVGRFITGPTEPEAAISGFAASLHFQAQAPSQDWRQIKELIGRDSDPAQAVQA